MVAPQRRTRQAARSPITLALDIGGTGLKATVVDAKGRMLVDRVRVETPDPAPPRVMVNALVELVKPLPAYDRISAGFPGVVRDGRVVTAPHFGTDVWKNFPLAGTLRRRLGKPARVLNDADVQGYGAVKGRGLEFVITLGTGMGSALFRDGDLMPHMEFAQFPFRKQKTFNDYVGEAARKTLGEKKWNAHLARVIEAFRVLLNFDALYLGGGNARHVTLELPTDVKLVPNEDGLTGGVKLWG
ncbi:MAG TPA: ROK family protein [Gemmatimonadaceae bacterium]|nr:ROK family protein [Gemmatimonadaceae bacterium]